MLKIYISWLLICIRHPLSVSRCGMLDVQEKMLNTQKFSKVKSRSNFFTGKATRKTNGMI